MHHAAGKCTEADSRYNYNRRGLASFVIETGEATWSASVEDVLQV